MSLQGKIYARFIFLVNKIGKRLVKPDEEYNGIENIDLEEIKKLKSKYGIGGILLDVDGTIIKYMEEITEENIKIIDVLKREFKIFIISNCKSKRIEELSKKLGVKNISCSLKPFKKPFIKASIEMGLDTENIIVIGDEFLTDILGGKRVGMKTGVVTQNKKKNVISVPKEDEECVR